LGPELVFYPGGLVRPHAYVWLGVALAPRGVRTVIPTMPFDLAVLGRDRAGGLIDAFGETGNRVVLAGHSLGGAMAAAFAVRNANRVDGLVLMGAYPAAGDDLSGFDFPTLVLAAEHDGLASLAEVQDGLARLPVDASLEVVPGAVHAFFGRYGPQRGDGNATVPRTIVERDLITRIVAFLASVP
jgi:Predicted esterase